MYTCTCTYLNTFPCRIVDSTGVTGFENYGRYDNQRSEVKHLDHEESYLLVGEFKEGSGLDYFTVR